MELEQLGPYRLVRKLGRGGMGTVYEGVNLESGVPAAVKLLSALLGQEEGFRERFEAEIETLLKLNHPNIVRLYGFGEQTGQLFYAMELVDGNSLEEELRRGRRFDWREVAQIGIDTCGALRHAHDRGVVHRDIKPGNLLLDSEGDVKLSDFGIARLFGNAQVTSAGSVLGTAEYMAPEQAAGKPVGPRSDLYSLGAVFYVLLTRRPLFQGKSLPEVLHKQQFEQPDPVGQYAPDVPEMLQQIIGQLLEKDPDERIPNPAMLERQLKAMQHALSLRPELAERPAENYETPEPDEADNAQPAEDEDLPSGQLPVTRPAGDSAPRPSAEDDSPAPDSAEPAPDELAETKPTAAFEKLKTAAMPREETSDDHFTAVKEEDLDRVERAKPRPAWVSPQTWMLAASLIAVGLTVWYFLQPPSAETLYERITAHTADGKVSSLRRAESDIDRFLHLYSDNEHCAKLREYKREIELSRLEKTFRLRAKGLANAENLAPIEREYLEAINCLPFDPEQGMAKLQALVDMYDHQTGVSGPTGDCLELARRRLKQLRGQLELQAAQHLAVIKAKLERAAESRPTDPGQARRIYRAIIYLYEDKPWAAERVQEARDALADIDRKE